MGREHLQGLVSLSTPRDTRGFPSQNKGLACEGRGSVTDLCWIDDTEGYMHMYGPGTGHIAWGAHTEVGEYFVMGAGTCSNGLVF